MIRGNQPYVEFTGVNYHFDAPIQSVHEFRQKFERIAENINYIRSEGFGLRSLNLSGLEIDHDKIPPRDLIESVRDIIQTMGLQLVIEAGGSLIGNTTVFVNKVVGVESDSTTNIIFTNGIMNEKPVGQSANKIYHPIEFAEPHQG